MIHKTINYLKDSCLVAKIQKFFGVNVPEYNDKTKTEKISSINSQSANNCKINVNGCYAFESNSNLFSTSKNISDKIDESKKPSITSTTLTTTKASKLLINNYFWYYLFLFSTELGDEIFYTTFIPFIFWNIDAAVGRKVVLVWAIIMTIGQVLKDIIKWPRPACPPAVRLQIKWSEEYGMPSTHAAVSVAIPLSMLIFTMNRYNYSIALGIIFVVTWSTVICVSRIYLGMHTILDVIAGLLLAIILMLPLVPLVTILDYYLTTKLWALIILIFISIATVVYYPYSKEKWTSTRGDTTMVVSVTSGINAGAWLNYKTGLMLLPPFYQSIPSPPYDIIWPTYYVFSQMILRTIVGFCCIVPNKIICKSLTYKIMCAILGIDDADKLKTSEDALKNKSKILVELIYKYIFSFMFGILAVHVIPRMFYIIGLERPAFYTEI